MWKWEEKRQSMRGLIAKIEKNDMLEASVEGAKGAADLCAVEKKKRNYRVLGLLFLTVAVGWILHVGIYSQLQQQLAEKVLRFHVLANSNEEEDQALKLMVRDEIGGYVGGLLAQAETADACRQILTEHLSQIQEKAQAVVDAQGYSYPVTVGMETCYFPLKAYGEAIFPPGKYQALRIVIGEGKGKNWWCVLYPNLCFSGSLYQVDEESGTADLQKVLTPEEYRFLMENKEYEVRFRLLEIFTNG